MGSASSNLWLAPARSYLNRITTQVTMYFVQTTNNETMKPTSLFINPLETKISFVNSYSHPLLVLKCNIPQVSGQLEQKKISPSLTNIL